MTELRDYQLRAVESVRAAWQAGTRAVCLVAPTGAGKTVLGAELARGYCAVLWVAHRRELVAQARSRLERDGHALRDHYGPAGVHVTTVQTLLARGHRPAADLVVLDEAHHYVAAEWRTLAEDYPETRVVGLTATPQRADGSPLGDVFGALVVAAQYSELIRDGHLVGCRVVQPLEAVRGLAADPLDAYRTHASGLRGYVYLRTVRGCGELAERFSGEGVPALAVTAKSKREERDSALKRLSSGDLSLLANVHTLTEGVDVPAASVVLLCRSPAHASTYLQMVGRVLRPHPGKPDALLVDLTGASLQHGLPTEDREYSLSGDCPIKRTTPTEIRQCRECGAVSEAWRRACPSCGHEPEPQLRELKIYSAALREVFAGADTDSAAKRAEYQRLRKLAESRGWSIGWVVKEYRKLFSSPPDLSDVSAEEKYLAYRGLVALGRQRGYARGFAAARYRATFGAWPLRQWGTG